MIEEVLSLLDNYRSSGAIDYGAYSALHDAISLIDGDWISVENGLPEPVTEVMVAVPMFGKARIRVGILARDKKT